MKRRNICLNKLYYQLHCLKILFLSRPLVPEELLVTLFIKFILEFSYYFKRLFFYFCLVVLGKVLVLLNEKKNRFMFLSNQINFDTTYQKIFYNELKSL